MEYDTGTNIMIKFYKILTGHLYLVVAGVVFLAFLLMGNLSRRLTFELVFLVVLLYLLSALVHHLHDKTLTFERCLS